MMILVVGKPDSGKSVRAEALALELARDGKKIYLATMEPFGEAGQRRIEKHRRLRAGKGFVTVEKPLALKELESEFQGSVCLLECVSNLVGNEMHAPGREGWDPRQVADLVIDEVRWLASQAKELVAVTNEFGLEEDFDEDTRKYVEITSLVNSGLEELAAEVIRVTPDGN
jgi:adenosylcobinamide kinase/adenosylcobinamide-phosphate guanylyltransferase